MTATGGPKAAGSDDPSQLPLPPAVCPLCAGPNACAPAAGDLSRPCWCTKVTFSQALLARVPEAERRRSCICRACAEQGPSTPPA
jgi:hypothetical protein